MLFPEPRKEWLNPDIERAVSRMQAVIELGRVARERRTKPFKTPLSEIIVYQQDKQYVDDLKSLESYIISEMNVKQITYKMETASQIIKLRAVPDQKRLGTRLRKDMGAVLNAVKSKYTLAPLSLTSI